MFRFGSASFVFLASCTLVLPWGDLAERPGASGDSGTEETAPTDGSNDGPSEGSNDGSATIDATGDTGTDAGGSYCDQLRKSTDASTLRICRDFDDNDLGEFQGNVNTPHAIDPTSFLSPPNSVSFTRPVGKDGGHLDAWERLILTATVHRADFSVGLNAISPTSQSGFSIRLVYGNDVLGYNVFGSNGVVATKSNNYPLSPNRFLNQWGTFRFVADFDAKTFRVFVNGVDEFAAALPLPVPSPAPTMLSVRLEMYGDVSTSMARWDNVSAFAE